MSRSNIDQQISVLLGVSPTVKLHYLYLNNLSYMSELFLKYITH